MGAGRGSGWLLQEWQSSSRGCKSQSTEEHAAGEAAEGCTRAQTEGEAGELRT